MRLLVGLITRRAMMPLRTHRRTRMTPKELYELLDKTGIDYEVVEIFEGVRFIRVVVEEEAEE